MIKTESIIIKEWYDMKYHPLCLVFPPMDDTEYDSLVDSMKDMGYDASEPITVVQDPDNEMKYLVLDGRNRTMAAQDAGVEPSFVEYVGDPERLVNYVTGKNIARRDLSAGQRAAIASKLATYSVGSNQFSKGTTLKDAAEIAGASVTSIKKLNKLKDEDPELAEQVATGEVSLNEAVNRTKEVIVEKEEEGGEEKEVKIVKSDPIEDLITRIFEKYSDRSLNTATLKEMIAETINEAMKL